MDSINQVFTNFAGSVMLTAPGDMSLQPAISGNFVQGVWTGSLTVPQTFTNLILQANDGAGHIGLANSINIVPAPSLAYARSGNSLLVFWPVDSIGFILESSTNLTPPQGRPSPTRRCKSAISGWSRCKLPTPTRRICTGCATRCLSIAAHCSLT
jgi:hypothetical protein